MLRTERKAHEESTRMTLPLDTVLGPLWFSLVIRLGLSTELLGVCAGARGWKKASASSPNLPNAVARDDAVACPRVISSQQVLQRFVVEKKNR